MPRENGRGAETFTVVELNVRSTRRRGTAVAVVRTAVRTDMPSSTNSTPPGMFSGKHPVYRSTRPASGRPSAPAPALNPSVLVIDDDDMVRRAIVRGLRRKYSVVDVRDAETALEVIASGQRFDAILCDLNLGGMSGRDFFLRLDASDEDLARRVVILSGNLPATADGRFGAALPRFLEKPASIATIEATLGQLARIPHAA